MNMTKTIGVVAVAVSAGLVYGKGALECWNIAGDFGRAEDAVREAPGGFSLAGPGYRVETTEETDGGVTLRRTRLVNTGAKPIAAWCLMDRFPLMEGDWDVYTQVSGSQNESKGAWQPLHTAVAVHSPFLRSCNGASPMLALWNRQTGRGRVFHLMTDSAYLLQAVRRFTRRYCREVVVEVGMEPQYLHYALKPGEAVNLPEVLTYEFTNRTDLDCHRLHAWWNRRHPGKRMPTMYNTWLYRFDKLTADEVLSQIPKAKALGIEYFVIDSGWYGQRGKGWYGVRGDWVERPDGNLEGRMAEISEAVRAAGMGFGLWLEPEAFPSTAQTAREHPDWVRPGNPGFYDFTNPAAVEHLLQTVETLIEKYKISYFKFDYNQNAQFDPTGRGFTDYNAGYRAFVRELRRRHPDLYIEGCASGGYMMDLGWARDFDSFWLTDNQGPRAGVRIAKETMLRLPPRLIERWIVARSLVGVQPADRPTEKDARILATDDSKWEFAATYSPEYIDAFTMGGPIGYSCDLTAFTDEYLAHMGKVVAERRRDGEFWRQAVGRILTDSKGIVVLQYSDEGLSDVRCLAIIDRAPQQATRFYPVLDPAATYDYGGKSVSGAELMRDGIRVEFYDISSVQVRLVRK